MKLNKKIVSRIVAGAYLAAWTTLLLVPNPVGVLKMLIFAEEISEQIGSVAGQRDKVIHAVGYMILFLLTAWTLRARHSPKYRQTMVVLFGFGAIHGAWIEVLQHFGSARQGDLLDWLADCVGLALGAAVYDLYRRWKAMRTASGGKIGSKE